MFYTWKSRNILLFIFLPDMRLSFSKSAITMMVSNVLFDLRILNYEGLVSS